MTNSELLQHIAGQIAATHPVFAVDLRRIACEHQKIALALDEIVDDARESAEMAERMPVVRRSGRAALRVVPT